jgi:hypothetical protein
MTVDGTYQLGAANAPLYFNSDGTGNTGGNGALRPERTTARPTQVTITNSSVVLQGPNTLVHSEGVAGGVTPNGNDPSFGWIQFTGVISGGPTNKLQLTTTLHSQNHGTYALSGANTFSGGIDLYAGRLSPEIIQDSGNFVSSNTTFVGGSHPNATFGTGDIHAFATPNGVAGATIARVTIPSGSIGSPVYGLIGDTATLTLDGNNDVGFRSAFAELGDGVVERVGALVLGGVAQASGGTTYGSLLSNADIKSDLYFSGLGVIQVGLAGDFNNDGSVNAADYVSWRQNDGTDAGYAKFRENFQPSPVAGSSLQGAAVPEPSTFALVSLCASLLVTGRRRRVA